MKNLKKQSRIKAAARNTLNPFGVISLIILLLYVVSLAIPFIWGFINSFRDYVWDYLLRGPLEMPDPWTNNYATVLKYFTVPVLKNGMTQRMGIPTMLLNSAFYAVGSAILAMLASLLMAYISSKYDFWFCKVIYVVVIIQMIIPIVGSLPSEIRMARLLNLYDNMLGMWIMKTYVSGLYFLIFYGSFKLIPKDYAEAAQLDGAGNFSVMVRIMFPFVSGSIFSVVLLNFIGLWNDYQTPLVYMPTHPTLAYGLYHFAHGQFAEETDGIPNQLAGCMMMALPLFMLLIIFQKKLVGNLSMGGLK